MSKRTIKEAISELLNKKRPEPILLRYQDEYFQVDNSGIIPIKAEEVAGKLEDYSQRCDSRNHFEHLLNHVFARLTNDRQHPDFPYVWLSELKYQGEKCIQPAELIIRPN